MSSRIQAFTPALAGYLSLLQISDEAPAVADLVAQGLAAPDAPEHFAELMRQDGWRPHLVGALAVLLDTKRRLDRDLLWTAIDRGSWVTPQLVATLSLADDTFLQQAQKRLDRQSALSDASVGRAPATGRRARWYLRVTMMVLVTLAVLAALVTFGIWAFGRLLGTVFGVLTALGLLAAAVFWRIVLGAMDHSLRGPGTVVQRSGKLAASLLACIESDPNMTASVTRWRTNPQIASLLREDAHFNASDQIARGWLARAVFLLRQRGVDLRAETLAEIPTNGVAYWNNVDE